MRVLVACERSGRVRDALIDAGHDAVSADLSVSDRPGPHIVGRVEDHLDGWDMVIGFPPCTFLSNVGAPCIVGGCIHDQHDETWREYRRVEAVNAAALFWALRDAAPLTAVENPQPGTWAAEMLGPATAATEPWWFGHPWKKRTLWWLTGLQPLHPTLPVTPTHRLIKTHQARRRNDLDGLIPGLPTPPPTKHSNVLPGIVHSSDSVARSETPQGLADAIAGQWPHNRSLF